MKALSAYSFLKTLTSGGGVRRKLFLVSLACMLGIGGLGGLWLEWRLRHFLEERVVARLLDQATTIQSQLESAAPSAALPTWFKALGQRTETRITVILRDGVVLADSTIHDPTSLNNHGDRPELRIAQEQAFGLSKRYSESIGTDMVYLAVALCRNSSCVDPSFNGGFVRASMPLESVEALVADLRRILGVLAIMGLGLAFLVSWLASYLFSHALQRLVEHTRAFVSGRGLRIDVLSTDEIGSLAGSFNRLADELEQTMATLAVERARFEAILHSMSEAVLVLDGQGRVLLVNPATSRLFELEGAPTGKPLSASIVVPELEELVSSGTDGPRHAEFCLAGDKPRVLLATATPLDEPELGGTVIVIHDVSEVRRLENIRKDFVANVSHELRTPVSIVQANAETLLDGALQDPTRARTFIEALHRNAERLSRIIADLLDLSRLEAGRYRFDLTGVDIEEIVASAIESVEARARAREQSIKVGLSSHHTAIADIKALEQVLTNLLENAIKYTPPGGNIWIRSEERDGKVRLEVRDDGPGIRPEHRTRVFERFYRIDAGRSRDMGGTGLGLAIVKHFVESMGGCVGVEGAMPCGSIFWLTVPADLPADAKSPAPAA